MLATAAVALACAACGSGSDSASYTVPLAPITFAVSLDGQGHVSVSVNASANIPTPVGTFGVSAGESASLARSTQGLLVAFRAGSGAGATDTDYEILTARELHVELDGHIVEDISANMVVITIGPGTTYDVTVTDADPHQSPPPSPAPDAGCAGWKHREHLPTLSIGTGGSDTVNSVAAKLHAMCLNVEVHVVHATDPVASTGTAPAGTIVEVSFATGRALWGVGSWQWCQYSYIFEWRWRMKDNNFSVGDHALHDDELVVADSGRAANIFVADGQPGPPWFNSA